MTEQQKLKEFIDEYFPVPLLREIGLMEKGKRKVNYEEVAQRICNRFGFATIYEYGMLGGEIINESPTVLTGSFPGSVDEKGQLIAGGGFHLDIIETAFECPACTCKQDATEHKKFNSAKSPVVVIKCKGCKRKLQLYNDVGGNLTVTEIKSTPTP